MTGGGPRERGDLVVHVEHLPAGIVGIPRLGEADVGAGDIYAHMGGPGAAADPRRSNSKTEPSACREFL